jgi:hypothetical protein
MEGAVDGAGSLHVTAGDLVIGGWLLEKLPPQLRAKITDLWSTWKPSGAFDVDVELTDSPRRVARVDVTGAEVAVEPGQQLALRSGQIVIAGDDVEFRSIQLEVRGGSGVSSTVEASGAVRSLGQSGQLDIHAERLPLELPVLADLLLLLAGADALQTWQSLNPAGVVELDSEWSATEGRSAWFIDVSPRLAVLTWRGHRLTFRDVGGSRVRVVPGELLLEDLNGDVGETHIDIAGRIGLDPMEVDIGGSVRGSLGGELMLALGGAGWSRVLKAIDFEDNGQSKAEALRVQLSEDERGTWSGSIDGQVMLADASLTTGLRLEHVDADIDVSVTLTGDHPSIDMGIRSASATIKAARLHSVSGRILSDPTPKAPDRIRIDELAGVFGDGRLVVDGVAGDVDEEWMVQVTLTDARLSKLFPDSEPTEAEPSTGEVDAALNLRGRAGDPGAMIGVGHFQVNNGHLRSLPALVAVQQLLHLSSPVVGALSFVDVEFTIRGGLAVLEKIHLASGPWGGGGFRLDGHGTLELDTMIVDARLRPRGSWPLIRDIIGAVQDQFYEVSMEGPIGHPEAGVIALPGLTSGSRSQ